MRKLQKLLTSTVLGQQYAAYDITRLLKSAKIYLYMYKQIYNVTCDSCCPRSVYNVISKSF